MMTETEIPVNNPLEFTVAFLDKTNAPIDPASGIKIKILSPSGVQTTLDYPAEASKSAVGIYSATRVVDEKGDWVVRGEGVLGNGNPVTTEDVVQPVGASAITF